MTKDKKVEVSETAAQVVAWVIVLIVSVIIAALGAKVVLWVWAL